MKTLIIEDDNGCAESLAMYLGGEVVIVPTMSAAVKELQGSKFDAVFVDLGLPDSTPDNTLMSIPALKALSPNTPFAIVTGFAGYLDAQLVDAIVRKPFDRKGIESAVEQLRFRAVSNEVVSPVQRASVLLLSILSPRSLCTH
jgi:DNA-binding NtrC family response regulator